MSLTGECLKKGLAYRSLWNLDHLLLIIILTGVAIFPGYLDTFDNVRLPKFVTAQPQTMVQDIFAGKQVWLLVQVCIPQTLRTRKL